MSVVKVSDLSKSYVDGDSRIDVLRGVVLKLDAGESMAITGPSGSGKSTLLNILAGTIPVDAGEILFRFDGDKLAWHSATERVKTRVRRRHIGYVHQFFNLIPTLTVLENVTLPAHLNKRRHLQDRAGELLTRFGLGHRLDVFPETLSGGEQQRVAVARALVCQPALLLADEPTGNLDAVNSAQVAELLFATARESGAALIVATHNEQVANQAQHHLHLRSIEGAQL